MSEPTTLPAPVHVVFGAPDPEQAWAEALCVALGVPFRHATAGEEPTKRCHPGNAYLADVPGGGPEWRFRVVAFECAWWGGTRPPTGTGIAVCDHHRPGDPGYGRPPAEYLEASSAGQLCLLLQAAGLLPAGMPLPILSDWLEDRRGLEPLRFVAAADHCLEAAYRGLCPGVDPDALMDWRAAQRAAFQRRAKADVLADVAAAAAALKAAPCVQDCGISEERRCRQAELERMREDVYQGSEPSSLDLFLSSAPAYLSVRDLRGRSVPELPEAACRLGVAYVASVQEPGGRRKVVLGGAMPLEVTERFLAGRLVAGLVELYGGPGRPCGGYLPD